MSAMMINPVAFVTGKPDNLGMVIDPDGSDSAKRVALDEAAVDRPAIEHVERNQVFVAGAWRKHSIGFTDPVFARALLPLVGYQLKDIAIAQGNTNLVRVNLNACIGQCVKCLLLAQDTIPHNVGYLI